MAVVFHRLAAAEFVRARRWYRRRGTDLETRFVLAIEKAIEAIQTHPELGAAYMKRYRWVRTKHFPYLLYYEVTDASTMLYAVSHARRRLGYWLRRTKRPETLP